MAEFFASNFVKMGGFFLLGIIFTLLLLKFNMQKVLFPLIESPYDFDTTVKKLKENILKAGWIIPITYDYRKLVMDAGFADIGRIEVIELCTPKWASKLLAPDAIKPLSVMLPCAFSVYQTKEGKVIIATLNNGLFAKIFGGFIGSVMGPASREEEVMIEGLFEGKHKK